jgi:hypothetical protein
MNSLRVYKDISREACPDLLSMGLGSSIENQLPRIHQAASGVFRPIGGFVHRYPSPQLHLTGRSSVACEHLHRTWFLHSEKMGRRKNLLNLGLE